MVIGMITGVIILFAGICLGCPIGYFIHEKEQKNETATKIETNPKKDPADIFRTNKGLLSYKKYIRER